MTDFKFKIIISVDLMLESYISTVLSFVYTLSATLYVQCKTGKMATAPFPVSPGLSFKFKSECVV